MNNSYYPELDVGNLLPLKVVFGSMANDPLWLERAECPYDVDQVEALREMWLAFRVRGEKVAREPVEETGDKWGDLEAELNQLYHDLRTYSGTVEEGDAKEKMAYFRTATSLLDKMVGLSERAHNVKSVSDFQARVIAVFDEILSGEQRTRAMEMLGE